MKNIKYLYILLITVLLVGSCKQEPIVPEPPVVVTPDPITGTKGSADFSKFVAVGDSYTAGFQASALFDDGQANSIPKIMSTQFGTTGVGGGAFNQPDINSANGFNATSSNVGGGLILGRLILFDPDGSGPRSAGPAAANTPARTTTCPSTVTTPALPAPYNSALSPLDPAFLFDPAKRAALNNFGVPGMKLLEATAVPSYATLNPFYGRFATTAGATAVIGDAASRQGSFFMLYLGIFDVLGYATAGGAGSQNGTSQTSMTPAANFTALYPQAVAAMLATPNSKGVVGNIPDVTLLPFFRTVPYNAVTLTADQATALNGAFAGYNQIIEAIKGNTALASLIGSPSATALDARKISYTSGAGNKILISEKDPAFDFGPAFDFLTTIPAVAGGISAQQRTALEPYRRVRQATSSDLIALSAGAVLGTCLNPPGDNATLIIGTSIPLADQFVLIPSETSAIQARITAFNDVIKATVEANSSRLALADVNGAITKLITDKVQVSNGVTITPNFAPPTGAFSEDGLHPNNRGCAFMANIFIDAINAKFGATVPKASLALYSGTKLPVAP